jgi:hypothetical protein
MISLHYFAGRQSPDCKGKNRQNGCQNFFMYFYEKRKSIKHSITSVVKLIYLIMLFYQIIILTIDYSSFPYSAKLDIIDDKQVLAAITICSDMYFLKERIKSYFNIKDEFYKISKYDHEKILIKSIFNSD